MQLASIRTKSIGTESTVPRVVVDYNRSIEKRWKCVPIFITLVFSTTFFADGNEPLAFPPKSTNTFRDMRDRIAELSRRSGPCQLLLRGLNQIHIWTGARQARWEKADRYKGDDNTPMTPITKSDIPELAALERNFAAAFPQRRHSAWTTSQIANYFTQASADPGKGIFKTSVNGKIEGVLYYDTIPDIENPGRLVLRGRLVNRHYVGTSDLNTLGGQAASLLAHDFLNKLAMENGIHAIEFIDPAGGSPHPLYTSSGAFNVRYFSVNGRKFMILRIEVKPKILGKTSDS